MSIRNWLASKLLTRELKESMVGGLISLFKVDQAQWTPKDYKMFADEGYSKNAVVFASINLIADSLSRIPLLLYRKRGQTRVELLEHPLLTLLKRPNPLQGGVSFLKSVTAYYQISGNAYIESISPSPNRPPLELYSHRSDRIKIIPGNLGFPAFYEYEVDGQKHKWEVDQIKGTSPLLQIKAFNPLNDWYGMSPIEAAAFGVDTHNKAAGWNKALLDNGARPSGALVYSSERGDGTLSKENYNKLKKQLNENHTGASNAGKFMILDGFLKWQEMGLSPKDMEFIENKNTSSRDIALAFGVPPMLLAIPGDNTYSNYQEARQALYEDKILPLLDLFLAEFNNWLTPLYGNDLELSYNEDKIPALAKKRQTVWATVKDADFLTPNEKREAVGYGEVVGGDTILQPMNLIPLGTSLVGSTDNGKGQKLLNLPSTEARHSEWQIQMNMLAQYEKALQLATFQILKKQARKSAEAFKASGLQGVGISLLGHAEKIERILKASYLTTGQAFGERIFESIPKSASGGHEVKDRDDFFDVDLLKWIGANTAAKVLHIASTTKEDILKTIVLGEKDGLSVNQIADKIVTETGGVIAETRAITIAVTESHSVAMASNDIAAEATGLPLKRRWLSAMDGSTRSSHLNADGQVRDMKEFFDVGSSKLLRPGDPSGSPAETINCRCIVDYITEGV